MFEIHPRLLEDTQPVGALALCRVLLMNDSRYPWVVLVPQREGVRELFELSPDDRRLLLDEVSCVAERMAAIFSAEKMNVAALGNVVPQLHVHVIARHRSDAAWPRPVWGAHPPVPYTDSEEATRIEQLRVALGLPG